MSTPVISETFDTYTAGALGGQGSWTAQTGTNPVVTVNAAAKLDGANSALVAAGTGGPANGYTELPFSTVIPKTAKRFLRFKVQTSATMDGTGFEIDLLTGAVDPTWANWTLGIAFYSHLVSLDNHLYADIYAAGHNPTPFQVDFGGGNNHPWTITLFINESGYVTFYLENAGDAHVVTLMRPTHDITEMVLSVMSDSDPAKTTVYDTFRYDYQMTSGTGTMQMTGNAPVWEVRTVVPGIQAGERVQECYFRRQNRQECNF